MRCIAGFFLADHTVAECEHMADFYLREFSVRLPKQLIHFDPFAKDTTSDLEHFRVRDDEKDGC